MFAERHWSQQFFAHEVEQRLEPQVDPASPCFRHAGALRGSCSVIISVEMTASGAGEAMAVAVKSAKMVRYRMFGGMKVPSK